MIFLTHVSSFLHECGPHTGEFHPHVREMMHSVKSTLVTSHNRSQAIFTCYFAILIGGHMVGSPSN